MIKGKRVTLRAVEERDLELLAQWTNDPDIASQVVGWTFPVSLAHQREWFKGSLNDRHTQRFVIETPDEGAIGVTGLWDIDWHNRLALTAVKFGPIDMRGKGYGTDAILTLMGYAFYTVGLNRLWGAMLPFNVASYKAYVDKCGWRVEGILRQEVYRNGKYYDLIRVAALAEDFPQHPSFHEYVPYARSDFKEPQITILDHHWSSTMDVRPTNQ